MTETTEKEIKKFDPFTTPARVNEINMVDSIHQYLSLAGMSEYSNTRFLYIADVQMVKGLCFEAQRFVLNQHWMLQLQRIQNQKGISTIDQRFCLLEEGTPEQWLKNFQEMIVPFIGEHGLSA